MYMQSCRQASRVTKMIDTTSLETTDFDNPYLKQRGMIERLNDILSQSVRSNTELDFADYVCHSIKKLQLSRAGEMKRVSKLHQFPLHCLSAILQGKSEKISTEKRKRGKKKRWGSLWLLPYGREALLSLQSLRQVARLSTQRVILSPSLLTDKCVKTRQKRVHILWNLVLYQTRELVENGIVQNKQFSRKDAIENIPTALRQGFAEFSLTHKNIRRNKAHYVQRKWLENHSNMTGTGRFHKIPSQPENK